jgi:hypothetical protein
MTMTIGVRAAMEAIIPGRRPRGPDRMMVEGRPLLLGRLLLLHLWHLLMAEVFQGRHLVVVLLLLLHRHLLVSNLFADSLTYPRTQMLGNTFG